MSFVRDWVLTMVGFPRAERELCDKCGRDPSLPIHEGWTGWGIDERMMCSEYARHVPEEYMRVRQIPVATAAIRNE